MAGDARSRTTAGRAAAAKRRPTSSCWCWSWLALLEIGSVVVLASSELTPGVEGQVVRVRPESGRVLTGQPVAERRVEIAL